jgi:hybrid cluster-associated redox disulfide protein
MRLEQHMTIRELLEGYPSSIKVFIKLKMFCVGCPAQTYHTLEDVARIYNYDIYALLENIRNTVQIEEKN